METSTLFYIILVVVVVGLLVYYLSQRQKGERPSGQTEEQITTLEGAESETETPPAPERPTETDEPRV